MIRDLEIENKMYEMSPWKAPILLLRCCLPVEYARKDCGTGEKMLLSEKVL